MNNRSYLIFCLIFLSFSGVKLYSQDLDTILSKYPNSDQVWEKVFENKQRVAENIYHKNETPWMTVRYEEQEGQLWKWYHENGNPYFEARIINNLIQGSYKIWYENGQLAEFIEFKDNRENGTAVFFHPNGQLAMKGNYQKGEMIGQWIFLDEQGNIPNGEWKWPFAASPDKIRMNGYLNNGKRIGDWIYTSTDGIRPQTFLENYNLER